MTKSRLLIRLRRCVYGETAVIQLTRLNNSILVVNSDLIKFVEQSPDTVITLLNGEKILVRESAEDVMTRVVRFRKRVMGTNGTSGSSAAQLASDTCHIPKDHLERQPGG
jgi:flagellar protein FlbD